MPKNCDSLPQRSIKPVSSNEGEGELVLNSNIIGDCTFNIYQWADGTIRTFYRLKDYKSLNSNSSSLRRRSQSLTGSLNGEMSIKVEPDEKIDPLSFLAAENERQSFSARKCVIEKFMSEYRNIERSKFFLTNLEPAQDHWEIHLQTEKFDTSVVIEKAKNYDQKIERLKEWREPQKTSKAVLFSPPLDSGSRLLMKRLNHLFTLGGKSKVSWIYYENYDINGNLLKRFYKSSVVKQYTPIKIIPENNFSSFLENSFAHYDEVQSVLNVHQAVNAFNDAKIENDYLELRGLKLINVIEYIRRAFLEDTD